jgi:hypothetical protein
MNRPQYFLYSGLFYGLGRFLAGQQVHAEYHRRIRGYRQQGRKIVIFLLEKAEADQAGKGDDEQRDDCGDRFRVHKVIFKD